MSLPAIEVLVDSGEPVLRDLFGRPAPKIRTVGFVTAMSRARPLELGCVLGFIEPRQRVAAHLSNTGV